jgi:signal peptidase I
MRDIVDKLARTPLSHVVILVGVLTFLRLAIYPKLSKTPAHMRHGAFPLFRSANELLDALVYAAVFVFLVIRPFAIQAFLIPSGSMWPTLYVNDFIVANKAIYRYSQPKEGDIVVFRPPVEAIQRQSDIVDGEVQVDFIKRCIGVPGDLVELKKGVLYRNGQQVPEPYTHLSMGTTRDSEGEYTDFRDLNDAERQSYTQQSWKLVKYHDLFFPVNYTDHDANSLDPARESFTSPPPYSIAAKFSLTDPNEMNKVKEMPAIKIPDGYYLMMGDNRDNSFDGRCWGLVPRDSIIGRAEFIWMPLSRWRITR